MNFVRKCLLSKCTGGRTLVLKIHNVSFTYDLDFMGENRSIRSVLICICSVESPRIRDSRMRDLFLSIRTPTVEA